MAFNAFFLQVQELTEMRKNVASQKIGAQLVSASDGSAFTGSVTVAVCGDAGTQATGSVGSGACTHEGNGYHTYAPSQAETNFDLIAFTFTGTGAVPVTVQVRTWPATGLLAPTVADRTLDVSVDGEAGIDSGVIPTVILSFDPITKAIGLVRSDAYLTSLGTAINIPVNIPTGVDANTISGARLGAKHRHKSTTLVGNVTLDEIDSQWTAIIEFPMSATAGKDLGEYAYDVEITYSSQDITILSGSLRLIEDYSTHA
jgi:hypothetical protein